MKLLRRIKINTLITGIFYVLLGLVFILLPEAVQTYVPLVAAVLLALLGIVYIIDYFRAWDIEFKSNGLAIGILMLFGALFLFLQNDAIMAAIPVLLGFAVIISGAVKLQNAIVLNKTKDGAWVYVFVLALVCLILGALFIVNPFASSRVLIIVIGAGLLFSGISDLVIILVMKHHVKAIKEGGQEIIRQHRAGRAKKAESVAEPVAEEAARDAVAEAEQAVAEAEQAVAQTQAETASSIAEQLEADRRNLDHLADEAARAQEAQQAAEARQAAEAQDERGTPPADE